MIRTIEAAVSQYAGAYKAGKSGGRNFTRRNIGTGKVREEANTRTWALAGALDAGAGFDAAYHAGWLDGMGDLLPD